MLMGHFARNKYTSWVLKKKLWDVIKFGLLICSCFWLGPIFWTGCYIYRPNHYPVFTIFMNDHKTTWSFFRENKWKPSSRSYKRPFRKTTTTILWERRWRKVTRPMLIWGFFIDSPKSTSWFDDPKRKSWIWRPKSISPYENFPSRPVERKRPRSTQSTTDAHNMRS